MTQEKQTCTCPTCNGKGKIEIAVSYTETHRPLAHELKNKGYTIRDIAKFLGYKNPGSVSHLLSKKPVRK